MAQESHNDADWDETETPDGVPDSAMRVQRGDDVDAENYVLFPVTDVIEWYTVSADGSVQREQFVDPDPSYPEDVQMALDRAAGGE